MNQFDSIVLGSMDIAQSEAIKRKNTELDAQHLLLGLVLNPNTFTSKAFGKYKKLIKNEVEKLPTAGHQIDAQQLRPSANLSQWLTLSSSDAIQSGRQELSEKDLIKQLPKILPNLDLDYELLKEAGADENSEVPNFLINLNEQATAGKLDPVIGRSKEIRSVMEILGRRSKNNPVLVGAAGVGKTAIIEGLAGAIVKGNVPDVLLGKTVYSLDLGALMAGTKFRGEFEERIQGLLKFIKDQDGQAILFIDEIHQLVGAGRTDGAMDAANLLKPALARGELHCIGATTEDEYQKYILGDSALERRFRSVPVCEPSVEDAIEILMGIREKLEIHHGIQISDDAVYNAVLLSDQYINNKFLPDKAIDLIDEAASGLKLSAEAMPPKLVDLQAEIRSKRILVQVEKDNKEITKEIDSLEKEFQEKKIVWEKEVLALKRVSELKNQFDKLKFDLETAQAQGNFEEASRIKYSVMPEVQAQLEQTQHNWVLVKKHVAQVISRQTGIPEEKILKSKQDNILKLENYLKERVYGQDECLKEISETLIASHAGLTDETRPLGSFLLLGPSGVGKTETVKGLAQYLFDSEKSLVRLDMSEYSEKHSVAKLIGAPAGYIGHDDGGVLTEAIRRRPYSVVLFDEIEKAHPDFADILLQIMDDGRLTDNKGRTISFKNTIIVLTSNSQNIELDFKPEVLGRLDSVLEYESISKETLQKIVEKNLMGLNQRLKSKKLEVELDKSALKALEEQGYDERYGARPLQSAFNRLVIRPLSKLILSGQMPEGKLQASWKDSKMEFQRL